MLKFFLLVFIVSYAIFKVGGLLFKVATLGGKATTRNQRQNAPRKPNGSNVEIDFVPQDKKKEGHIQGGEYVDYEEVK